MADWHGGSTLGGYPLAIKMATDGYLTRFSGRTLINSSILDDGLTATLKNANVTGTLQLAGVDFRTAARTDNTKAFILEVRTSDPASPVPGQMWFRSDL